MRCIVFGALFSAALPVFGQLHFQGAEVDTVGVAIYSDTMLSVQLPEVPIISFRTDEERMEYYKTLSRIRKVMPYVKIAKQLYTNLLIHKEEEKRRTYRSYRKDLEKEMRNKFEKELKDLSVGQGKVLVKLINRETGNNCYGIIKEVKGGFSAFGWQIVAKHYDYNLKEKYDPKKERIIELAIKTLGKEYDIETSMNKP